MHQVPTIPVQTDHSNHQCPLCAPTQVDRGSVHGYGWHAEALESLLGDVQREWRIENYRVYVTGISMGGYGTWRLALQCPDRLAAAAPVCREAPASVGTFLSLICCENCRVGASTARRTT